MNVLASLRERNRAVWNRDVHLPDYTSAIAASDAEYIPALEARVTELEAALSAAQAIAAGLADMETPPFGRDYETYECALCSLDTTDIFDLEVVRSHGEDCLWRQAKEWAGDPNREEQ